MELLERVRWTNETPAIYVNIYYEYQRSGSDMQYRTKLVIEPVKGQSYFGWQIIANITSEGVQRANPVIKQNSPSQWTSNIEWTSDWWTVSNKTTGSSSLSVQLYSNGYSRNQTYNYSMYVAPAYTSVSKWSVSSKTETSITLSWQTAHTCSQIRYGISTSSYTTANVNASSGSITINNLTANTNYTLYFMPCRKDSGLWGDGSANIWKSTTQQTYNYPYATTMPNFTIESGVVITLYNPLGRAVSLTGIGAGNTTIFTGSTSSTSATITMSASNISAQYNSIPNTKSATYQVKTTYGSSNITKTGGTYSTNASLCSPIFTNFSVIDDNEITTALTDNNHYNVNGYTTALVIIHNEDKAEPQKGATMSKYLFSVGNGTPIEIPYTNLETSGSIPNAPSGVYNVWAVDSRGNSTLVSKNAEQEIVYTDIVKDQITIERQNDIGEQTTLTFNGTFWGNNFGLVDNSITNVRYRYKQTGDDWPSVWNGETTITPLTNGNNYSFTGLIEGDTNIGFDVSHSYNIEVEVSDELSSTTFSITLGSGTPNIAIHKEGVAINGMYDENDTTNKFQINGNTKISGNETITGSLSATSDINSGGVLKEKNMQITPIDINATTSTILSRVKSLGSSGIKEATWFTATDGGTSGISDKPTGSTNAGFVCNAICNRYASSSDYRYVLTAYVQADTTEYVAVVTSASTTISWVKRTIPTATSQLNNDSFKFRKFEKNMTIGANGMASIDMGAVNVPSGYSYLGTLPIHCGFADQWVVSFSNYDNNHIIATGHSKYGVSLTHNVSCYAVYIKDTVKSQMIL